MKIILPQDSNEGNVEMFYFASAIRVYLLTYLVTYLLTPWSRV